MRGFNQSVDDEGYNYLGILENVCLQKMKQSVIKEYLMC